MSGSVSRRYPPELWERAVRMVAEIRSEHESEWAAMKRVAELLGVKAPGLVRGLPRVWLAPGLWGFVLAGWMSTMPKPYPKEFRDDVVAVARKGQVPLNQIAGVFGIFEGCLHNWMKKADIEDGNRPGVSQGVRRVARAQESQPAAGGRERGPAPCGRVLVAGEPAGKRIFPLVREMAAAGAPITVPVAVP
jgi:transposase-like protein